MQSPDTKPNSQATPEKARSEVSIESRHILGMRVDCTNYTQATQFIAELASDGRGASVCIATVHMVMEAQNSESYRGAVNGADLVTSDGMPLVWCLRLLGLHYAERVYGPTLMPRLCAAAESSGLRVGMLGGTDETLTALSLELRRKFPDLNVTFSHAPPFRTPTEQEDLDLVAAIEDAEVQLLFVGLGCPKQERWMAEHRERLHCTSVGVGAAFDFIAGSKRQAPAFLQQAGFEWLFRLLTEPRRLWRRWL